MEVRAKKALGQHFLVDLSVAQRIVAALAPASTAGALAPALSGSSAALAPAGAASSNAAGSVAPDFAPAGALVSASDAKTDVLEIGPGMGVLSQYLLQRNDLNLKLVELDGESVEYLMSHFNGLAGKLYQADYLKLDIHKLFAGTYSVIGNFPYNISSQIFFKILDDRDRVPEVVCMVQKEVAQRIAEGPGSKTYGILSVLLQAWYTIEYLFTVEPGAFAPPPKVRSAVIRLRRNTRTALCAELGADCTNIISPLNQAPSEPKSGVSSTITIDEKDFRKVVKTAFGQRRKTLRNALRPLLPENYDLSSPILQKRAEQLSVSDFINLTASLLYTK